jgi:predicted short-subunit dehydrogenase-like oxidoreductase (DUF2520 family)
MGFKDCRVNVIGAGRLGKVMAYLFSRYHGMEIVGICNQSLVSSELAAIEIGQGKAYERIAMLEPADVYLIAVPDDKISQIALELKEKKPAQNVVVMHFSAHLSTQALSVLDCRLASVHPLLSFSDFQSSIANFTGAYCAIEANEEDLSQDLMRLFTHLGAKPFIIQAQAKVLYHTAAVIAANYTLALAHGARTCLIEAGIEEESAIEMILPLMQSVLNNLKTEKDCKAVLTGPIARGDIGTIQGHLHALSKYPKIKQLYQVLGNISLEMVQHSKACMQALKKLLDDK